MNRVDVGLMKKTGVLPLVLLMFTGASVVETFRAGRADNHNKWCSLALNMLSRPILQRHTTFNIAYLLLTSCFSLYFDRYRIGVEIEYL